MTCVVCQHDQRADIENELLCRQWGAEGFTLESIAEKYKVPERDLQVHALMHLPVQVVRGEAESIAQKINMTEAEVLRQTASNYYITLQQIGAKINKMLASGDSELRGITKPLVDLYLGAGAEIRNSTDCLVKMNQAINGENNSGLNALAALVTTLKGSDNND